MNNMIVMFLAMVIVNTATSYIIKIHGHYVLVFNSFAHCSCHRTLRMVFPWGGVCNKLQLKFHVIKLIKEKIRPRSWDMYFEMNV